MFIHEFNPQLCQVVFALLAMTGRATMLNIFRWGKRRARSSQRKPEPKQKGYYAQRYFETTSNNGQVIYPTDEQSYQTPLFCS